MNFFDPHICCELLHKKVKKIRKLMIEHRGGLKKYEEYDRNIFKSEIDRIKKELGEDYKKKAIAYFNGSGNHRINGHVLKIPKLYDELNNKKKGFKKFFLKKVKETIKDELRMVFVRFLDDKRNVCEECYVYNLGALDGNGLHLGAVDNTLIHYEKHGVHDKDLIFFSLKNVCYFDFNTSEYSFYSLILQKSIVPMCKECKKKLEPRCSCCAEGITKRRRCSRCKEALYCSKECQIAHWKVHKSNCCKNEKK